MCTVTRGEVGGRGLLPCRRLRAAHLDRVGTAGVEIAPARRSSGIRHLPLQHDAPRACARVRLGNGGEERRRVRVLGSAEELVGRRQLHHAPDVHHGHAVADVSHDAQVVRHEEIRQPKLGLQIEQEIQDLGLHRHVQGRDGLIGDHQARVQGERARDADALSLAPAEGSLIWFPMVWTGLNDDIGSWKMSAISAPRIARISWPFGASFARSTT